jgi:hypothetical protein
MSNINMLCTETLVINNAVIHNNMPATIIASYYTFTNYTEAKQYLDNISSDLNTTPWPGSLKNLNVSLNKSKGILYTKMIFYGSPKGPSDVYGVYEIRENKLFGVTVLNATSGNNYSDIENIAVNLLNHISN